MDAATKSITDLKTSIAAKDGSYNTLSISHEKLKADYAALQEQYTSHSASAGQTKAEYDRTVIALEQTRQELSLLKPIAEKASAAEKSSKEASDQLASAKVELETMSKNYKEEQVLRKKYYNMMEDMKGKIRVYCRCRPFNKNELEMVC